MPRILAACGGFLLAVLWIDLMFDVQVLAHEPRGAPLPEHVLSSISAYYWRWRVVGEAVPMRRLISVVILVPVGGSLVQAFRGRASRWRQVLPVLLSGGTYALAAFRVFANAARLGARTDSAEVQSALAFAIFHDHVLCFLAIGAFITIQLSWSE
jgi:hypothetical protein